QPPRENAVVAERLNSSTKSALGVDGLYSISLRTRLRSGRSVVPVTRKVRLALAMGIGLPRRSSPATTSAFVSEGSATCKVQVVGLVQITGCSTPFTVIVRTPMGAVPPSVIKFCAKSDPFAGEATTNGVFAIGLRCALRIVLRRR